MAPGTGLEPATSKLTASCSTIELPGKVVLLYTKRENMTIGFLKDCRKTEFVVK